MMNFKQKYLKYKQKYLLLKKKIGGKVEGMGSFGLVMSSPRLPLMDETYEIIKDLNHVSKILYVYNKQNNNYYPANLDMYNKEYEEVKKYMDTYPKVITHDYFILPINGGMINIREFINNHNYDDKWYENSTVEKILYDLFLINRNPTYQIIYNKGITIDNMLKTETTLNFISLMINPITALNKMNNNGMFLKDIKSDNMIFHDNKIKISDWSDFFDLNGKTKENINMLYNDNFLTNVFYFVNSPIASVLLCLYSNTISIKTKPYNEPINSYIKDEFFEYLYNKALDQNHNTYRDYVLSVFDRIKSKLESYFDLVKVDFNAYNFSTKFSKRIVVSFTDLWNSIYILYHLDPSSNNNVEKIFRHYKSYLDSKLTIDEIFKNLLRTNNMFAIGQTFIYYLDKCLHNNIVLSDDIIKNIMKIIIFCLGKVIIKDGKVYVSQYTLNDIQIFIT